MRQTASGGPALAGALLLAGPNVSRAHSQPTLQRFPAGATHPEPHAVPELHLWLPPLVPKQRLYQIQSHDGRPVDAHELRWIQLLLQILHSLADEMAAVFEMEPGVGPSRYYVLDVGHRHRLHPALRLNRDPVEVTPG